MIPKIYIGRDGDAGYMPQLFGEKLFMMISKILLKPAVLLVLAMSVVQAMAQTASLQEKTQQGVTVSSYTVVDDFEDGTPLNNLGGPTGAWNMNNDDINAYWDARIVPVKDGLESSKKCLMLSYSVDSELPAQNGYWAKLNTFDASSYDHLEFDVKGDNVGCTSSFRFEIKKFKDLSQKTDKLTGMMLVKDITPRWKRVSIPLTYFNGLYDKTRKDLYKHPEAALQGLDEYIIVFHKKGVSAKKGKLYLDNIRFVRKGSNGPSVFDRPPAETKDKASLVLEDPSYKKKYLIAAAGSKNGFKKVSVKGASPEQMIAFLKAHPQARLWMKKGAAEYTGFINEKGAFGFIDNVNYTNYLVARLKGFPKTKVIKKEFPEDDTEFLRTIAKDTWLFFDHIVDQEHSLPLDTIALGSSTPRGEGCTVGDYTNVTNIGIYLCSVVSAYDLGFISRRDAVSRITKTLKTVKKLETSKWGFLYNYYDTTWATRTEYFISLVDSGWLTAGIYVAKNAFPEELTQECSALLARENYRFFYDPVEQQLWHGYYENMGEYANYHYGMLFAEPRLASFIAVGRGEIETEHWYRMKRTSY